LRNFKQIIATLLLTLWCGVQLVDALHHMHEEHEDLCTNATEHFCEPHAEIDVCGLCTVVHASITPSPVSESYKPLYPIQSIFPHFESIVVSFYKEKPDARGPPHMV
jgi:hypothetical protein